MGLGVGAAAQAVTTAPGPYYAMPSWDQTLPAATRFIVLSNMNNEAVLDRETGLVWERAPDAGEVVWAQAIIDCIGLNTGGRRGWRLPSIHELSSLIDDINNRFPALPTGHPFSIHATRFSWTATPWVTNRDDAFVLYLGDGSPRRVSKSKFTGRWCVRGGQGPEAQ